MDNCTKYVNAKIAIHPTTANGGKTTPNVNTIAISVTILTTFSLQLKGGKFANDIGINDSPTDRS